MVLCEHGIPAIAPQSESIMLKDTVIAELKGRFSRIIINFDFDLAGVRGGQKYRKIYGLECKYFTNGRLGTVDCKVKDCAEFIERYGGEEFKLLINNIRASEEQQLSHDYQEH